MAQRGKWWWAWWGPQPRGPCLAGAQALPPLPPPCFWRGQYDGAGLQQGVWESAAGQGSFLQISALGPGVAAPREYLGGNSDRPGANPSLWTCPADRRLQALQSLLAIHLFPRLSREHLLSTCSARPWGPAVTKYSPAPLSWLPVSRRAVHRTLCDDRKALCHLGRCGSADGAPSHALKGHGSGHLLWFQI